MDTRYIGSMNNFYSYGVVAIMLDFDSGDFGASPNRRICQYSRVAMRLSCKEDTVSASLTAGFGRCLYAREKNADSQVF